MRRNDRRATNIKKRMAYIMKEICHKDTREVTEYLKISQPTLSRYVVEIKKQVIDGLLNKDNILRINE